MQIPDYLMVSEQATSTRLAPLIGETGFSFKDRDRPGSALTPWMHAGTIPPTARAVLQTNGQFEGLTGLLRVPTEADTFGRCRAGWILGRTAYGLTSIVVRDDHHCSAEGLLDDASFAVTQAGRYCATSAVILVQQSDSNGGRKARAALGNAFIASDVRADVRVDVRVDVLYEAGFDAAIPLWFACLSAVVR
ncbi:hypothetical protein [Paraburkholderia sp. ZP32-5]|uniref:hypothetical protein n=1 Tax=Paraburkholderia sp. ZP32-5 TaxID=2883245 RepID=UPI001F460EF4|nr:hypothetical protein [Paraburkholderia sp. ZP32-5]